LAPSGTALALTGKNTGTGKVAIGFPIWFDTWDKNAADKSTNNG